MNKLMIIGNLTADPESRTTQAGKNVTSFTVAVNRRRSQNTNQPEADYFKVNAWGELGTVCKQWLIKGRKVCVVGSVSATAYQTQNGEIRASMNVLAETVEFLTPANQAPQTAPQTAHEPQKTDAQSGFVQVEEEELPF